MIVVEVRNTVKPRPNGQLHAYHINHKHPAKAVPIDIQGLAAGTQHC